MDNILQYNGMKASDLIHRAIDQRYELLRTLMQKLVAQHENERTQHLLNYLLQSKQLFLQLYILCQYTQNHTSKLRFTNQLLQTATAYKNQVLETNDRLFFMHANLNRAKERPYDVSTAVDVLSRGAYIRFPSCMRGHTKPFLLADTNKFAQTLDDILRFRMIHTKIPKQLQISIHNGIATFTRENVFQFSLTILGLDDSAKYQILQVKTYLKNPIVRYTKSTQFPNAAHFRYVRFLLEKAINQSDDPFLTAFQVMHEFCSCLALHILREQSFSLVKAQWKDRVEASFNKEYTLELGYWPHIMQQVGSTSRCCIRIGKNNTNGLVSLDLSPSLPLELYERTELMKFMEAPPMSAEKLCDWAMKAHSIAFIFSLQRALFYSGRGRRDELDTVQVKRTGASLVLGLKGYKDEAHALVVAFDTHTGTCTINCPEAIINGSLSRQLEQLKAALFASCKVRSDTGNFSLHLGNAREQLINLFKRILYHLFQEKVIEIAARMNVHVQNEHWDREKAKVSDNALTFFLSRGKHFTFLLVFEIDRLMERESENECCFSLLQLGSSTSTVHYFERFPVSKCWMKNENAGEEVVDLSAMLLLAIDVSRQRMYVQQCRGISRRKECRMRMHEGYTNFSIKRQHISLLWEENVFMVPFRIREITVVYSWEEEMELHVMPVNTPFPFTNSKHFARDGKKFVTTNGELVLRYSHVENPLELCITELQTTMKKMCDLGVALYALPIRDVPSMRVESANPWHIVLAIHCPFENLGLHRVSIEFREKFGYVLHASPPTSHPMLNFIQSAFNSHGDAMQLVEALERTVIPLAILSSVVESRILSEHKLTKRTYELNDAMIEESYLDAGALMLIPQSQTRLRVLYKDKASIHIEFQTVSAAYKLV